MKLAHAQLGRLNRLLDAALELDADGRVQWLERLPPGDADLREALAEALLGSPAVDLQGLAALAARHLAGEAGPLKAGGRIGPYTLIRELGQGGMAQVWLAQRTDGAFRREVALKVPKLHNERQDLASRFARETDILAGLEHAHIARLYDAGVTPEGLPYLAMEYVAGRPIDAWCDGRRSSIQERIRLFLQVLEAVEYAHRHGVLHRDIKPSNVLVTDEGQVRLLDFGVARLLETTDTRLTQVYGKALTPAYASPEQMNDQELDLASDVYSLGVLLHELLVGTLPPMAAAEPASARSPAPSKRIDAGAAPARGATPAQLTRQLAGELDAVVMKALEADPGRRYRTAGELAQHLRAYLEGRPVTALPTSAGRRALRFVWRNPMMTLAASAVAVALGLAVIDLRQAAAPAGPVPTTVAAVSEKSVAVLPFLDMSEGRDQEYFSDGLTEELIDKLTKVPELRVPARTSSFFFKGKQMAIAEIARTLGVANILEGSVRKNGRAIRVTAQLIRADTGYHVWSETYDRTLDDIFRIQDDIAGAVVSALQASLTSLSTSRPADPSNGNSYDLLKQAQFFIVRSTPEDQKKALQLYQRVVDADPRSAAAWAGLSRATAGLNVIGAASPQQVRDIARRAAERAIALDPGLSEAHIALGKVEINLDRNFPAAQREFERARVLDPEGSVALYWTAVIAYCSGDLTGAIRLFQEAIERDPLDGEIHYQLGEAYFAAGRLAEAETSLRKALDLVPSRPDLHADLGVVMLARGAGAAALQEIERESDAPARAACQAMAFKILGKDGESRAALAGLVARQGDSDAYSIAQVYALYGDSGRTFAWLDRAFRQDEYLFGLKVDPWFAKLRADPRFTALVQKLGLPA